MATSAARSILAARFSSSLLPTRACDFSVPVFLAPTLSFSSISSRSASNNAQAARAKKKDADATKKKKKRQARLEFRRFDTSKTPKFSLCDAIRYIHAAEVGRDPASVKYELHVSLRGNKNGPTLRQRLHLPHLVKTAQRVAVICPADGPVAEAAREAGASACGEEFLFDAIRAGDWQFDKLLCHAESLPKLQRAGLGRLLGPKGLMPSEKQGTVVSDVAQGIAALTGAAEYRERFGVVRLAIGSVGFTPEQLQDNIKSFMTRLKADLERIKDRVPKAVHEVVLSSTNGPGIPLSGDFRSADSISAEELRFA